VKGCVSPRRTGPFHPDSVRMEVGEQDIEGYAGDEADGDGVPLRSA
jgi:hypothetical protein